VAGLAAIAGCGSPPLDYCALGARKTLVFVDVTTPYDETDKREIRRIFGEIVTALGTGDRLSLRTIEDQYATSQLIFDDCKPGCPESQSALDEYLGTGCATTQAQADLDQFLGTLIQKIQPLIRNDQEALHSDIIATVGRLTNAYTEEHRYDEIVLYSDMLENSPSRPWTWVQQQSEETLLRAVTDAGLLPRADGAVVRIFGFGRVHNDGRPQLDEAVDNRLRRFWTNYFTAGGATEVLFNVSPGQ